MQPVARSISDTTVTKWSLELLGNVTGVDQRIEEQSKVTVAPPGGGEPLTVRVATPFDKAFVIDATSRWAVQAGFSLLFGAATVLVQALKPKLRLQQD